MRSKVTGCAVPLAALLFAGQAGAGQLVLFVDGRTLRVAEVEVQRGVATLVLEGGGELAVPARRIENWSEIKPDAAPAAIAPPEPAIIDGPWRAAAGEFAEIIASAALRHDLDPALLTSVAHVESAFNPRAVSPKGAKGLLQLMPATAVRFGVTNVFDPSQNVHAGARYLRWLLERFEGQVDLALAGYNAGENAVDRYAGIPPYPETRNYVRRVLRKADDLALSAP